jgi:hypothetical protein
MRKGQVWPSDRNAGKRAADESRGEDGADLLARREAGQGGEQTGAPALDALFVALGRWWSAPAGRPTAQQGGAPADGPGDGDRPAAALVARAERPPNPDGLDRLLEEVGRQGPTTAAAAAAPAPGAEAEERPLPPAAGALSPEEEARRDGALSGPRWRAYAAVLAAVLGPLAFYRLRPARRSNPQLGGEP